MKKRMNVKEIKIDLIDVEGQMIRYAINDERVVELAMSIQSKGLLNPVTVTQKENGRFQLQAGSRRLTACKRIKWKTIPANIREDDGTPIKTIALIENCMQEPMTLAEEVEVVCHLYDAEKQSPAMICDTVGKGRTWVDQRLAIPHLHEEVANELLDGRISLGHAEIINQVAEQGLRSLLLNNVMQQKLTKRQTKELAEIYKATPTMEDAIEKGIEAAGQAQGPQTPTRKCDHCGAVRPLSNIVLLAVCVEGCEQPQLKAGGDDNGDRPGGEV